MKRGFTLIEVMIYIAMIALIFTVFTGMVLAVNKSYTKIAILRNMDIAGITTMERMTREIRGGTSVDAIGFGVLSLNQLNSKISFATTTENNIQVRIDDVDQGTLLPSGVTVSSLIFRQIDTGRSIGVKIEMLLAGKVGNATSSEFYYSTVILRGSYK
ncbi:MAG: prepilin-type N-terminal cleavage/methylation domain-containing protein [bacterium]|nr:prepilin-type N-terminal cleavage/methylation domain-containing protein [bacterium]